MLALFEAIGWIGGAVVALAYVLVSTRRIAADTPTFQGLNILGASMLGVASLQQHALPSAGWNLVWVLISLQSLVSGVLRTKHQAPSLLSDPTSDAPGSSAHPERTRGIGVMTASARTTKRDRVGAHHATPSA